jgi:hypothetical protein
MTERAFTGRRRAIVGSLATLLLASYIPPNHPTFGCSWSWPSMQRRGPALVLNLHGVVWILNDDSSITIVLDDERPKNRGPSCWQ